MIPSISTLIWEYPTTFILPLEASDPCFFQSLPIVSIVVPFFGLTNSILRILKGSPKKGTTMETIGTAV